MDRCLRWHYYVYLLVLVDPSHRGRGLGRQVMEEAEHCASRVGVEVMHLSTHDQQAFYSHLGYGVGPVVSPQRSCVARLGDKVNRFVCYMQFYTSQYIFLIKLVLRT